MNNWLVLFITALVLLAFYLGFKIIALQNELEEMERLKKEIYNLGENMSAVESKEEAFELILDSTLRIIRKVNKGSILMLDEDGLFRFKASRGYPEDLKHVFFKMEEIYLYKCNGFSDTAIINNPAKFNKDFLHKEKYDELKSSGDLDDIYYVLSSPIRINDKIIGILNIDSMDSLVTFNQDDINMMNHIKNELELSLKNFLSQENHRYSATHDDLTDLYNRRSLRELLNKEIKKVKKYNTTSQLVLIDLDDFKIINDTFGHEAGDKALLKFSSVMKKVTLPKDICARMSGDEFVIIFNDSTIEDVERRLSYIEKEIAVSSDSISPMYFSYGITSINPEENLTGEELLMRADKKMYALKKNKKVKIST